jgi:hypothetical protein
VIWAAMKWDIASFLYSLNKYDRKTKNRMFFKKIFKKGKIFYINLRKKLISNNENNDIIKCKTLCRDNSADE